jgi:cell division protein FtsZ
MSSMGKAMMGTGEAEGEGRAVKAAEAAIHNPLIDDYTLKGAKGLLVNITGGKDLKLFEVDEAVNKVRAEVDPDAELIIGAITDTALDGKMRVSIVATSLDGQQPESKSVINMVHRIQNRNPGYAEIQNSDFHQSFNFSSSVASPVFEGATALKLENEIQEEVIKEAEQFEQNNNEVLGNSTTSEQSTAEEPQPVDESETSNGLENFEIEEETPELFNSEAESVENLSEEISDSKDTDHLDEDDLEIPAFLRRQKN